MSIKIEIYVPEDQVSGGLASEYLDNALSALGFSRPAAFRVATRGSMTAEASAPLPAPATQDAREADALAETSPKRERGKPAPGKTRRTKEEIAEDEAADTTPAEQSSEPAPEEPAETQAQDAADEAADPVNQPGPTLTREDLVAAMKAYMGKFGLPALNEDMSKLLLAKYPAGNITKQSEVPDEDVPAVCTELQNMLTSNPNKREPV